MVRNMSTSKQIDWLRGVNAQELAKQIEAYWHKRGHKQVRVFVTRQSLTPADGEVERASDLHVVRSNLVRGLPQPEIQSFAADAAKAGDALSVAHTPQRQETLR
jgi:hypothetical protein